MENRKTSQSNHRLHQAKVMIFDVDNTLYPYTSETRQDYENALVKSARKGASVSHISDQDILKNCWQSHKDHGDPYISLVNQYSGDHRKLHQLQHAYLNPDRIQPNPKLRELLLRCRKAGISLYAYSDGHHGWTLPALKKLGLDDVFEDVLTRDTLESFDCKRNGDEGYRILHEKAKCRPGQIVMVDDAEGALATAKNYGMLTALIADKQKRQPPVHDVCYATPEDFLEDFLKGRGLSAESTLSVTVDGRSPGCTYPKVHICASLSERNEMGVGDLYYKAKSIFKTQGKSTKVDYTEDEKIDAAIHVVNTLISDDYIDSLVEDCLNATLPGGGKPSVIKLVFPMPVEASQTANALTPTFAAIVEHKMNQTLRKKGYDIRAECSFDIYSVSKVARSIARPKVTEFEEKYARIGHLARQTIFSGLIDPKAAYLVIDDSIFQQSTFANLVNYIHAGGGTVASAATLVAPELSTIMQSQPESHKFLLDILHRQDVSPKQVDAVIGSTPIFGGLNMHIGEDLTSCTLTNVELLLLAAYFGNHQDIPALQELIALGGGDKLKDALGLVEVALLQSGNPEELETILKGAVKENILLNKQVPDSVWISRFVEEIHVKEAQHAKQ